MLVTMDRYEADWSIVERGWKAHVLGEAEYHFDSIESALRHFRKDAKLTDQNLPAFVIQEEGRPAGVILDGDSVVCFNFRGDRAIQISKAFEQADFSSFERRRVPKVCYAGMMQYDGDLKLPQRFLVAPPKIEETFGEFLCEQGVRQYACSETQKFGHVTYFWNGNRSGKFNDDLEEYVEIPSDRISFHLKPAMQAYQIMTETVARMKTKSFSFGRINFANGDMVGHTGDFEAAVIGVGVVDV
jgi:2,3-bisphosphoglycerate-independent phosphoglycerate mutase